MKTSIPAQLPGLSVALIDNNMRLLLALLLCCFIAHAGWAEKMELVYFFPSPQAKYEELIVYSVLHVHPSEELPPCDEKTNGALGVSKKDDHLKYCNNQKQWQSLVRDDYQSKNCRVYSTNVSVWDMEHSYVTRLDLEQKLPNGTAIYEWLIQKKHCLNINASECRMAVVPETIRNNIAERFPEAEKEIMTILTGTTSADPVYTQCPAGTWLLTGGGSCSIKTGTTVKTGGYSFFSEPVLTEKTMRSWAGRTVTLQGPGWLHDCYDGDDVVTDDQHWVATAWAACCY